MAIEQGQVGEKEVITPQLKSDIAKMNEKIACFNEAMTKCTPAKIDLVLEMTDRQGIGTYGVLGREGDFGTISFNDNEKIKSCQFPKEWPASYIEELGKRSAEFYTMITLASFIDNERYTSTANSNEYHEMQCSHKLVGNSSLCANSEYITAVYENPLTNKNS